MRPWWRDALATVFVVIALGLYAAWALGVELAGLTAVGAVALAVLGLGILASASAVVPGFGELLRGSRGYLVVSSAFGVLALGAGLYAVIAGEAAALSLLVLATLAMWAMATVRHAAMHRPKEHLIRR